MQPGFPGQFKGNKNVVLSFYSSTSTGVEDQVSSFNGANARFEERNAQVLGVSCDSQHSHRAWSESMGDVQYPLLADFHPHGEMSRAYGLFNDAIGTPKRAIIIVDKGGTVQFRRDTAGFPAHPRGDPRELDKLGADENRGGV